MTDRARSEFNIWWERQPFKDQFADVKEQMGNVWVASREECVVELPAAEYIGDSWSGDWAIKTDEVREAIEAAGLKCEVKP